MTHHIPARPRFTVHKVAVAAVAVLADALAKGVLHGSAQTVAEIIVALAGLFGIWRVPNRVVARQNAADQ